MASEELTDFLGSLGEEYLDYAETLQKAHCTRVSELAAASRNDLMDLQIPLFKASHIVLKAREKCGRCKEGEDDDEEGARKKLPEQAAFGRLEGVCKKEGLLPFFDGRSALFLTAEKLQMWWALTHPDGAKAPDFFERVMRDIERAAEPLRLAYPKEIEQQWRGSQVPIQLSAVERVKEQAVIWTNVLEMEAVKCSRGGDADARADIHTCGYYNGVGKTFAAKRAANPSGCDLEEIRRRISGTPGMPSEALARLPVCMRITINLAHLSKKPTGSFMTAEAAVAGLIFGAFQKGALKQLGLVVENEPSLKDPMDALKAMRKVLGPKVHFMLHFEDLQTLRAHAVEDGWFTGDIKIFEERVSPIKDGGSQKASEHRGAVVRELAGTYGLWVLLTQVITEDGVSALLTGRTLIPYMMGRKYITGEGAGSPGKTFVILLPPLTASGILEVCEKTACRDGRSILEHLGFTVEQAATVRAHLEARSNRASACPSAKNTPGTQRIKGKYAPGRQTGKRKAPATADAPSKQRRRSGRQNFATAHRASQSLPSPSTPRGSSEAEQARVMAAAVGQTEMLTPCSPTAEQPASALAAAEQTAAPQEQAGSLGQQPYQMQGAVSHQHMSNSEQAEKGPAAISSQEVQHNSSTPALSAEEERLARLLDLIVWITCGVPLLVREVLDTAEQMAAFDWASMSVEDMTALFRDPQSKISRAVADNERSFKEADLSGLTALEKHQLMVEAVLEIQTQVQHHSVLQTAVIKASVYTRPAADQEDMLTSSTPTKDHDEDLRLVPQVPPPVLSRLKAWSPPAALLAQAVQRLPGCFEQGKALETMLRFALAGKLAVAAVSPMSLADAIPFLADVEGARTAAFKTALPAKALPGIGTKDQGPVLGLSAHPQDVARLLETPWGRMLPEEEAGYQMDALADARIGLPHPTSAGPDLFLLVGEGLYPFQCKCYHGKGRLGMTQVATETARTAKQAMLWKERKSLKTVCLIFFIVGEAVSKGVRDRMGRLLLPGTRLLPESSKAECKTVPEGLQVIIPNKEQMEQLLGEGAHRAFERMAIKPEGAEPLDLEEIARALAELRGG